MGVDTGSETNYDQTIIEQALSQQKVKEGYTVQDNPFTTYKGWEVRSVVDSSGYSIALYFSKDGKNDAIGVSVEDGDLIGKARNWIDTRLANS